MARHATAARAVPARCRMLRRDGPQVQYTRRTVAANRSHALDCAMTEDMEEEDRGQRWVEPFSRCPVVWMFAVVPIALHGRSIAVDPDRCASCAPTHQVATAMCGCLQLRRQTIGKQALGRCNVDVCTLSKVQGPPRAGQHPPADCQRQRCAQMAKHRSASSGRRLPAAGGSLELSKNITPFWMVGCRLLRLKEWGLPKLCLPVGKLPSHVIVVLRTLACMRFVCVQAAAHHPPCLFNRGRQQWQGGRRGR